MSVVETVETVETDYIFSVDWFSIHIELWTIYLNEFKGKENLRFLEIGSYQGRSTVWLLENILTEDTSSITCIDTFEGSVEHRENERYHKDITNLYDVFSHNISKFKNKVRIIQGMSQVALKQIGGDYDFVYVDGDHRASSVMEDAILSFALLKRGGLMIFDDYEWTCSKTYIDDPKPAIDAFMILYADKIKVLFINQQVIIRKL